jgi:hypothetical protein
MKELIYTDEEKEFLDYFSRLKKLVRVGDAWNEESKRFQKEQINLFSMHCDKLYEFAKSVFEYRNEKATNEHAKWNTSHNVVCPDCKEKLHLKPLGEIKLDDDLTYFQFYCKKCLMNFESKKPNNDDDLILWNAMLIERLRKAGKGGLKHYEVIGMSETVFKETLKKHKNFKEKVAEMNFIMDIGEKKYQDKMNGFDLFLQTLKKMVDDQSEGLNVFGIRSELKSESPYLHSKDENELMVLLNYFNELKNKKKNFWKSENKDSKTLFKRIEQIEKEMKSHINEIVIYHQSAELNEDFKWNHLNKIKCTHCSKEFKLIPCGEIRDSLNMVHFSYYCPECDIAFDNPMPNNNRDKIKFYENAINNPITTKEANEHVKKDYILIKQNYERELKYEKSMEDLNREHIETVEKHLGELILLKQQLITGSSIVGES